MGKTKRKKGGGKDWDNMYLEYNEGKSHKFWEITRNKTKITTRWGKQDTKGQELTKDYGSMSKEIYLRMIDAKKKKGYVLHRKKPKKTAKKDYYKVTTKLQKDYLKICSKAEQNKKLNPNQINYDCETMIFNSNSGEADKSDLRFMANWYKQAIKVGEFDWQTYNQFYKSKRKKKRSKTTKRKKKGGGKTKMTTSEFKEFLQGKEREGWKEVRKCNKTCSTIKTNYAKNKKKLKQQRECYGTCDKNRLIKIRKVHKQYSKEFKQFIKNM